MTDPDNQTPFRDLPEEDRRAFHALANTMLAPANAMMDGEAADKIAAAFVFACALFNAPATEVQSAEPVGVDAETGDYLEAQFRTQMREHMAQSLVRNPAAPDDPNRPPFGAGRVAEILSGLDGLPNAERSALLDLGDRFIAPANEALGHHRPGGVSGAMMHACTRFNVFVMQALGHRARKVDDSLIDALAGAYRYLLYRNMAQSQIASPA